MYGFDRLQNIRRTHIACLAAGQGMTDHSGKQEAPEHAAKNKQMYPAPMKLLSPSPGYAFHGKTWPGHG
jgi:hypothetical protein